MDVNARREAADALRAIKRGGEGWFSLSEAVMGRPAPRDEVVARLADLIDPGEDTTVSAYDLLSEEDRETLRWVKESGGIDAVQKEVSNYAALCRSIQDADNRRAELCSALGTDLDTGWSDAMAEMMRRLMPPGFEWTDAFAEAVDFMESVHDLLYTIDGDEHTSKEMFAEIMKRLMPVGIEWPRYESGEPVPIGGEFMGKDGKTYTAKQIQFIGKCFSLYDFCDRKPQFNGFYGERVKRPAVLAADGKPLREGETAWDTDAESDTPLTVVEVSSDLIRCEYTWKDGKTYRPCYPPDQLTHERPDSWERIEEDAEKDPCGYFGFDGEETCGKCPAPGKNCEQTMASDLVRRCRALAERERGE